MYSLYSSTYSILTSIVSVFTFLLINPTLSIGDLFTGLMAQRRQGENIKRVTATAAVSCVMK